MMRRGIEPIADSGVRPFYMFVGLGAALLAILGQLSILHAAKAAPKSAIQTSMGGYKEAPRYGIVDRHGTELALSVRRHALEASPFNLWLRHTPERIHAALTGALGGVLDAPQIEDVFRRSFATDADGRIVVERWPLEYEEALAVSDWIAAGGPADNGRRLPGFDVLRLTRPDTALLAELGVQEPVFGLAWEPRTALSEEVRARFADYEDRAGAASRWTHRLGAELFGLLEPARERELARAQALAADSADAELPRYYARRADLQRPPETMRDLARGLRQLLGAKERAPDPDDWVFTGSKRDWVMDGLLPVRYVSLLDPVEAPLVQELREALGEEELGVFEMWLQATSERRYPAGDFSAVGGWGWIADEHGPLDGVEHAAERALSELGESLTAGGDVAAARHLEQGSAERLSIELLFPHGRTPRSYYLDDAPDVPPARVVSTLDAELNAFLGRRLEQLVADKTAGLAMGVVIDVATREVLALDWRDPYGFETFAPLQHFFTPGSTFKTVTMSLALELGLVRPDEIFDVGTGGQYLMHEGVDGTGRQRWIREADGYLEGLHTAAECLAHSSNAGLVQIGTRVPVEEWRARTAAYGYAEPAAPRLLARGMENRAGQVGEFDERGRPWKRTRSHASVSFGDSTTTNLLQHATALVALLDDGVWRPLRFVSAVEHAGRRFVPPAEEGRTLIGAGTRDELRAMLRLGATEGTGSKLERAAGLVLHSKTGTTEKLSGDVCQHRFGEAWGAALDDYAAASELAEDPDAVPEPDSNRLRRSLRGDWGGRSSCYVSSIALLAAAPGTEREVFVLLVVDDPHVEGRAFGSRVAGPAAMDVLHEALGLTRGGAPLERANVAGFGLESLAPQLPAERVAKPWAVAPGELRRGRRAPRRVAVDRGEDSGR